MEEKENDVIPLLPWTHECILDTFRTKNDGQFVQSLDAIRRWPSEIRADLRHFMGVMIRCDEILQQRLKDHPYLVVGGPPPPSDVAIDTFSAEPIQILRFLKFLVHHSANKAYFLCEEMLTAYLGARCDVLADTALLLASAVMEPSRFYAARDEDTFHGSLAVNSGFLSRLCVLANTWEGVSYSNTSVRSSATRGDAGLWSLLKVATATDSLFPVEATHIVFDYVPDSSNGPVNEMPKEASPVHFEMENVFNSDGYPRRRLRATRWSEAATSQPAWKVTSQICSAAGIAPHQEFDLHCKVRRAREATLMATPEQRRWFLARQLLALSAILRCDTDATPWKMIFASDSAVVGEHISELALYTLTNATAGPALAGVIGSAMGFVPLSISYYSDNTDVEGFRAAVEDISTQMSQRTLQSVALSVVQSLLCAFAYETEGKDAEAAGALPSVSAVAHALNVSPRFFPNVAVYRRYNNRTSQQQGAAPWTTLLQLADFARNAVQLEEGGITAIATVCTPVSELIQSVLLLLALHLPAMDADAVPAFVDKMLAFLDLPVDSPVAVTLTTCAMGVLSESVVMEASAARWVGAALRKQGVRKLCQRIEMETAYHLNTNGFIITPEQSESVTNGGSASPGLDFSLGAPALPECRQKYHVMGYIKEYRKELLASLLDVVSDALQPAEGVPMSEIGDITSSAGLLLRTAPNDTPPPITVAPPIAVLCEEISGDPALVLAVKRALVFAEAFGATFLTRVLNVLDQIVQNDPSLCLVLFDRGVTPLLLQSIMQRKLPMHSTLYGMLPSVLMDFLLTESARERIAQYFAAKTFVHGTTVLTAASPIVAALPAHSPMLSGVNSEAIGRRRRAASIVDASTPTTTTTTTTAAVAAAPGTFEFAVMDADRSKSYFNVVDVAEVSMREMGVQAETLEQWKKLDTPKRVIVCACFAMLYAVCLTQRPKEPVYPLSEDLYGQLRAIFPVGPVGHRVTVGSDGQLIPFPSNYDLWCAGLRSDVAIKPITTFFDTLYSSAEFSGALSSITSPNIHTKDAALQLAHCSTAPVYMREVIFSDAKLDPSFSCPYWEHENFSLLGNRLTGVDSSGTVKNGFDAIFFSDLSLRFTEISENAAVIKDWLLELVRIVFTLNCCDLLHAATAPVHSPVDVPSKAAGSRKRSRAEFESSDDSLKTSRTVLQNHFHRSRGSHAVVRTLQFLRSMLRNNAGSTQDSIILKLLTERVWCPNAWVSRESDASTYAFGGVDVNADMLFDSAMHTASVHDLQSYHTKPHAMLKLLAVTRILPQAFPILYMLCTPKLHQFVSARANIAHIVSLERECYRCACATSAAATNQLQKIAAPTAVGADGDSISNERWAPVLSAFDDVTSDLQVFLAKIDATRVFMLPHTCLLRSAMEILFKKDNLSGFAKSFIAAFAPEDGKADRLPELGRFQEDLMAVEALDLRPDWLLKSGVVDAVNRSAGSVYVMQALAISLMKLTITMPSAHRFYNPHHVLSHADVSVDNRQWWMWVSSSAWQGHVTEMLLSSFSPSSTLCEDLGEVASVLHRLRRSLQALPRSPMFAEMLAVVPTYTATFLSAAAACLSIVNPAALPQPRRVPQFQRSPKEPQLTPFAAPVLSVVSRAVKRFATAMLDGSAATLTDFLRGFCQILFLDSTSYSVVDFYRHVYGSLAPNAAKNKANLLSIYALDMGPRLNTALVQQMLVDGTFAYVLDRVAQTYVAVSKHDNIVDSQDYSMWLGLLLEKLGRTEYLCSSGFTHACVTFARRATAAELTSRVNKQSGNAVPDEAQQLAEHAAFRSEHPELTDFSGFSLALGCQVTVLRALHDLWDSEVLAAPVAKGLADIIMSVDKSLSKVDLADMKQAIHIPLPGFALRPLRPVPLVNVDVSQDPASGSPDGYQPQFIALPHDKAHIARPSKAATLQCVCTSCGVRSNRESTDDSASSHTCPECGAVGSLSTATILKSAAPNNIISTFKDMIASAMSRYSRAPPASAEEAVAEFPAHLIEHIANMGFSQQAARRAVRRVRMETRMFNNITDEELAQHAIEYLLSTGGYVDSDSEDEVQPTQAATSSSTNRTAAAASDNAQSSTTSISTGDDRSMALLPLVAEADAWWLQYHWGIGTATQAAVHGPRSFQLDDSAVACVESLRGAFMQRVADHILRAKAEEQAAMRYRALHHSGKAGSFLLYILNRIAEEKGVLTTSAFANTDAFSSALRSQLHGEDAGNVSDLRGRAMTCVDILSDVIMNAADMTAEVITCMHVVARMLSVLDSTGLVTPSTSNTEVVEDCINTTKLLQLVKCLLRWVQPQASLATLDPAADLFGQLVSMLGHQLAPLFDDSITQPAAACWRHMLQTVQQKGDQASAFMLGVPLSSSKAMLGYLMALTAPCSMGELSPRVVLYLFQHMKFVSKPDLSMAAIQKAVPHQYFRHPRLREMLQHAIVKDPPELYKGVVGTTYSTENMYVVGAKWLPNENNVMRVLSSINDMREVYIAAMTASGGAFTTAHTDVNGCFDALFRIHAHSWLRPKAAMPTSVVNFYETVRAEVAKPDDASSCAVLRLLFEGFAEHAHVVSADAIHWLFTAPIGEWPAGVEKQPSAWAAIVARNSWATVDATLTYSLLDLLLAEVLPVLSLSSDGVFREEEGISYPLVGQDVSFLRETSSDVQRNALAARKDAARAVWMFLKSMLHRCTTYDAFIDDLILRTMYALHVAAGAYRKALQDGTEVNQQVLMRLAVCACIIREVYQLLSSKTEALFRKFVDKSKSADTPLVRVYSTRLVLLRLSRLGLAPILRDALSEMPNNKNVFTKNVVGNLLPVLNALNRPDVLQALEIQSTRGKFYLSALMIGMSSVYTSYFSLTSLCELANATAETLPSWIRGFSDPASHIAKCAKAIELLRPTLENSAKLSLAIVGEVERQILIGSISVADVRRCFSSLDAAALHSSAEEMLHAFVNAGMRDVSMYVPLKASFSTAYVHKSRRKDANVVSFDAFSSARDSFAEVDNEDDDDDEDDEDGGFEIHDDDMDGQGGIISFDDNDSGSDLIGDDEDVDGLGGDHDVLDEDEDDDFGADDADEVIEMNAAGHHNNGDIGHSGTGSEGSSGGFDFLDGEDDSNRSSSSESMSGDDSFSSRDSMRSRNMFHAPLANAPIATADAPIADADAPSIAYGADDDEEASGNDAHSESLENFFNSIGGGRSGLDFLDVNPEVDPGADTEVHTWEAPQDMPFAILGEGGGHSGRRRHGTRTIPPSPNMHIQRLEIVGDPRAAASQVHHIVSMLADGRLRLPNMQRHIRRGARGTERGMPREVHISVTLPGMRDSHLHDATAPAAATTTETTTPAVPHLHCGSEHWISMTTLRLLCNMLSVKAQAAQKKASRTVDIVKEEYLKQLIAPLDLALHAIHPVTMQDLLDSSLHRHVPEALHYHALELSAFLTESANAADVLACSLDWQMQCAEMAMPPQNDPGKPSRETLFNDVAYRAWGLTHTHLSEAMKPRTDTEVILHPRHPTLIPLALSSNKLNLAAAHFRAGLAAFERRLNAAANLSGDTAVAHANNSSSSFFCNIMNALFTTASLKRLHLPVVKGEQTVDGIMETLSSAIKVAAEYADAHDPTAHIMILKEFSGVGAKFGDFPQGEYRNVLNHEVHSNEGLGLFLGSEPVESTSKLALIPDLDSSMQQLNSPVQLPPQSSAATGAAHHQEFEQALARAYIAERGLYEEFEGRFKALEASLIETDVANVEYEPPRDASRWVLTSHARAVVSQCVLLTPLMVHLGNQLQVNESRTLHSQLNSLNVLQVSPANEEHEIVPVSKWATTKSTPAYLLVPSNLIDTATGKCTSDPLAPSTATSTPLPSPGTTTGLLKVDMDVLPALDTQDLIPPLRKSMHALSTRTLSNLVWLLCRVTAFCHACAEFGSARQASKPVSPSVVPVEVAPLAVVDDGHDDKKDHHDGEHEDDDDGDESNDDGDEDIDDDDDDDAGDGSDSSSSHHSYPRVPDFWDPRDLENMPLLPSLDCNLEDVPPGVDPEIFYSLPDELRAELVASALAASQQPPQPAAALTIQATGGADGNNTNSITINAGAPQHSTQPVPNTTAIVDASPVKQDLVVLPFEQGDLDLDKLGVLTVRRIQDMVRVMEHFQFRLQHRQREVRANAKLHASSDARHKKQLTKLLHGLFALDDAAHIARPGAFTSLPFEQQPSQTPSNPLDYRPLLRRMRFIDTRALVVPPPALYVKESRASKAYDAVTDLMYRGSDEELSTQRHQRAAIVNNWLGDAPSTLRRFYVQSSGDKHVKLFLTMPKPKQQQHMEGYEVFLTVFDVPISHLVFNRKIANEVLQDSFGLRAVKQIAPHHVLNAFSRAARLGVSESTLLTLLCNSAVNEPLCTSLLLWITSIVQGGSAQRGPLIPRLEGVETPNTMVLSASSAAATSDDALVIDDRLLRTLYKVLRGALKRVPELLRVFYETNASLNFDTLEKPKLTPAGTKRRRESGGDYSLSTPKTMRNEVGQRVLAPTRSLSLLQRWIDGVDSLIANGRTDLVLAHLQVLQQTLQPFEQLERVVSEVVCEARKLALVECLLEAIFNAVSAGQMTTAAAVQPVNNLLLELACTGKVLNPSTHQKLRNIFHDEEYMRSEWKKVVERTFYVIEKDDELPTPESYPMFEIVRATSITLRLSWKSVTRVVERKSFLSVELPHKMRAIASSDLPYRQKWELLTGALLLARNAMVAEDFNEIAKIRALVQEFATANEDLLMKAHHPEGGGTAIHTLAATLKDAEGPILAMIDMLNRVCNDDVFLTGTGQAVAAVFKATFPTLGISSCQQCVVMANGSVKLAWEPEAYQCPVCVASDKKYSRGELIRHALRFHDHDTKSHVCPICTHMPGADVNRKSNNFTGHLLLRHTWTLLHDGIDAHCAEVVAPRSPRSEVATSSHELECVADSFSKIGSSSGLLLDREPWSKHNKRIQNCSNALSNWEKPVHLHRISLPSINAAPLLRLITTSQELEVVEAATMALRLMCADPKTRQQVVDECMKMLQEACKSSYDRLMRLSEMPAFDKDDLWYTETAEDEQVLILTSLVMNLTADLPTEITSSTGTVCSLLARYPTLKVSAPSTQLALTRWSSNDLDQTPAVVRRAETAMSSGNSAAQREEVDAILHLDMFWHAVHGCMHETAKAVGVEEERLQGAARTDLEKISQPARRLSSASLAEKDLTVLPKLTRRFFPLVSAFFVAHPVDIDDSIAGTAADPLQSFSKHSEYDEGGRTVKGPALSLSADYGETEVAPAPVSGVRRRLNHFAEQHREIINEMIRQDIKLLSGPFYAMLALPECRVFLDLPNKTSFFRQQLKALNAAKSGGAPPIQLNLRRKQVFQDSYSQFLNLSGDDLRGNLDIRFKGEEGVDAGGLTREWYEILAREMFNPDYALFKLSEDGTTFQPNPMSGVHDDHLAYFRFVGRVIGKGIADGQLLDAHFTRSFYKHILGVPITYQDIEAIDPQIYKSLNDILNMEIDDLGLELYFVAEQEFGGSTTQVELIPGGKSIPVTDANKWKYVQLVTSHRMTSSILAQTNAFLTGFHELIPPSLISIFSESELELLIAGLPSIDIADLKANTEYLGYRPDDEMILWFWEVLESFDQQDRARFLMFVTGTSKVPPGGFKALRGQRGPQKFTVEKSFGGEESLPQSHTCFNTINIPFAYSSAAILREKLLLAIREGGEGFGLV